MLLKRFEAKTLPEAIERVRAECGEHALVVETRPTPRGFLVVAADPETATPTAATAAVAASTSTPSAPRAAAPRMRDQAGGTSFLSKWTRGFQPLAQKALEFGLSETVLRAVERALLGTKVELSRAGDPALPSLASRVLAALVHTEPGLEDDSGAFRTVALVGPTGVGKTTTLAKLAARARDRGERVAIVTLDTYRMAAVEQLRTFAELLDVPFAVAHDANDMRRALQQFADCDRVFVDTTGRSPRNRERLPLVEATLRAAGASTLLCLAAGTRGRDAQIVIDAYEPLGIEAVCLTKWDETVAPGEALAAVVERGLPLSHVCVGQEVPADILAADAGQLARAAFDCETAEVSA